MNMNIHTKKNKDIIKKFLYSKLLKYCYPIKPYYNTVIPLNIYQTWHTKKMPELMRNNVDLIKKNNPAFNYYLFDDKDCRNFIELYFDKEILNTYDCLIPGAYKADLWRYCVLYKNGGIYLDIKYKPVNNFKFINLTEKEHWVLDMDKKGVYNALMVSKPNNPILLKSIHKIVENVKNKFYGKSSLEPTGPLMLEKFFSTSDKNSFDMYHDIYLNIHNRFIFFNNYIIFRNYKNYIQEQKNNKKCEHYSTLWEKRCIYKN
jgi:mannosyltransferase OCH1-like enzyme